MKHKTLEVQNSIYIRKVGLTKTAKSRVTMVTSKHKIKLEVIRQITEEKAKSDFVIVCSVYDCSRSLRTGVVTFDIFVT